MPALPKVLSGLISNAMTAKAATEHAYERNVFDITSHRKIETKTAALV